MMHVDPNLVIVAPAVAFLDGGRGRERPYAVQRSGKFRLIYFRTSDFPRWTRAALHTLDIGKVSSILRLFTFLPPAQCHLWRAKLRSRLRPY